MCQAHKDALELSAKLQYSLTGKQVTLCGIQEDRAEKGKCTVRKIKEDIRTSLYTTKLNFVFVKI